MRIVVHVLLHAEGFALLLEHHAEVHVEGRCIRRESRVVCVLDIAAGIFAVEFLVHAVPAVLSVHFLRQEETSAPVHLGGEFAVEVPHPYSRNACGLCDTGVVGAEGRSDMHDSGTVLGGDVIARYHLEGAAALRGEPRNQLVVGYACELAALEFAFKQPEWLLSVEPYRHEGLCKHVDCLFTAVRIGGKHPHVVNVRTYAEGRVGRKGPRGGGPGQEEDRKGLAAEELLGLLVLDKLELGGHCSVLHVAVAARLVELVGAEAGSRSRGIRLYGEALVEQSLVVDLLQEVPECLYVAVVIGDVRVVHIHPVTYALGEGNPLLRVFHDLGAAGLVVLLHTDLAAYVFLGYTQFLLHTQFDRKTVGVPACTAVHLVAALGLVTADGVLYGPCHHVMYARHAIG